MEYIFTIFYEEYIKHHKLTQPGGGKNFRGVKKMKNRA